MNDLGKLYVEVDTRHSAECQQAGLCAGDHCVSGVEISLGGDDGHGGIVWHTSHAMISIEANSINGLFLLRGTSPTKYAKVHLNGTGYVLADVRVYDNAQVQQTLTVRSVSSELASSGQWSAAATVDGVQSTCYRPMGRKTVDGCGCAAAVVGGWAYNGVTVSEECGNPDGHSGGDWCFTATNPCAGADRGVCASETRPWIVYSLGSELPDRGSCTPPSVATCAGCTLSTGSTETLALSNGWGLSLGNGQDGFGAVLGIDQR